MGFIALIAVLFLLVGVGTAAKKGRDVFGVIYKELRPFIRYEENRRSAWARLNELLLELGFYDQLREDKNRLFLAGDLSAHLTKTYRLHRRDFKDKLHEFGLEVWSRRELLEHLEDAKTCGQMTAEVFCGRARMFSHFLVMPHLGKYKNRISFIGYSQE